MKPPPCRIECCAWANSKVKRPALIKELVSDAFDRAIGLLYALPDKEKKEFF